MESQKRLFVGREHEINELVSLSAVNQADMVAVLGRRRVGKTYLIKHAYQGAIDFHFTGIKNAKKSDLLTAFTNKIVEYSVKNAAIEIPKTWLGAFEILKNHLKTLPKNKKKVVFLDEFPWISNHRSGFLQAFEYFWNDWAVDQNITVIICGSSTSWMIKYVMNNKAGLHNRITKYIKIKPFTLKETEQYFIAKGMPISKFEIAKLYMAIGGIPYYLNEVKKGYSAIQNIDQILFSEKSTLKNEFNNLYKALFDNYLNYELVIKAISSKRIGISRYEIIKLTKITNGGGLSKILNELEECDFIQNYVPFGKEKRDGLYRLIDEYSMFYYQFNPHKNIEGSFISLNESPKMNAWAGFAFETLCLKHTKEIKEALKIAGIFSKESSYNSKGNEDEIGVQIDLLIDRNDNCINICEIKYSQDLFELSKIEAEKIRKRKEIFRKKAKVKKQLFNTLITTYGLKPNMYSIETFENTIVLDQLFV